MKEIKYVSIDYTKSEEINNENLDIVIVLESENIDIMEVHGELEEINKYLRDNKNSVKLLTKEEANELGRRLVVGTPIIYDNEYGEEFETVIKDFNVDDGIIFDEIDNLDDSVTFDELDGEIWHTLGYNDENEKLEISNMQRIKVDGEIKWTDDIELLNGIDNFFYPNISKETN